eukprot:COSAG06_NODE_50113_length_321_cov_0.445946_1_plen_45_part_10
MIITKPASSQYIRAAADGPIRKDTAQTRFTSIALQASYTIMKALQ